MNLIKAIANKFYNVEKEDLIQVGVIGLLEAYKNYKNEGKAQFSTYAYNYIFGSMYALSLSNRDLKVSRSLLKIYKLAQKTRYFLTQKLGHLATLEEVALYLEIDLKDIENAYNSYQSIMRLDDDKNELNLHEVIPAQNPNLDLKLDLQNSFKVLNPDEKQIIKARYYDDLTQSEVAKKLNMTQVMVSRYEKKGLQKMRTLMQ